MRKLVTLLVLAGILLSFQLSAGDKILGVDPLLINGALQGKDLIFRRKYDQAMELFKQLEQKYPKSPTGLAGQMAIWQVKMFEHDDFRYMKEFVSAEKKYNDFATATIRKGDIPPWDFFIYGAADGMRGFFKTRQGNWLGSLSNAMHAVRMLDELKWREPNLIDADLGFGAYIYWRSAITNEIKILPFFRDRRKEGINLLQNVIKNGKYAGDLALGNLIFIYGNENKYGDSIKVADQLLEKYPENIVVRYQKGRVFMWAKKYNEALKMFEECYVMDPTIYKALLYEGTVYIRMGKIGEAKSALTKYVSVDSEKYGLAVGYYWLGRVAEAENNKPQAIEYYTKSLTYDKLKESQSRLKALR